MMNMYILNFYYHNAKVDRTVTHSRVDTQKSVLNATHKSLGVAELQTSVFSTVPHNCDPVRPGTIILYYKRV